VKETGDTHTDHIIHHTHHMHVVLSIHGRFQNVEHWRRQSAGCCIDGHTEGLLENNLGNAVTAGVSLTLTTAGVSLTTGEQARCRRLPAAAPCLLEKKLGRRCLAQFRWCFSDHRRTSSLPPVAVAPCLLEKKLGRRCPAQFHWCFSYHRLTDSNR
jgi:hypothetical protein